MTITLGLRACPACAGGDLIPVVAGMATNFYCLDCAACWPSPDAGTERIDPASCPGCVLGKHACTRAARARGRTRADDGWPDIESRYAGSLRESCTGIVALSPDRPAS